MSPTRRQLLAGLLSVSGVSGCLSTETEADKRSTESAAEGRDDDPTVLQPRNLDGETIITETTGESTTAVRQALVTDRGRADELGVATGVSDADRQAIRTFLDETTYASETVFIIHRRIRSCYRYRIQSVSWDETDIEYRHCRELRPPNESCTTDSWETVGLLFRLPAVVSPTASLGGSRGHSPCQESPTTYDRIESNATVVGNTTAVDTPTNRFQHTGGES